MAIKIYGAKETPNVYLIAESILGKVRIANDEEKATLDKLTDECPLSAFMSLQTRLAKSGVGMQFTRLSWAKDPVVPEKSTSSITFPGQDDD